MRGVSYDDSYTTRNFSHRTETIFINFVQESCSNACEALLSFDNEENKQDICNRWTESTRLLVDVSSFNNITSEEDSDTNIQYM